MTNSGAWLPINGNLEWHEAEQGRFRTLPIFLRLPILALGLTAFACLIDALIRIWGWV